MDRGTEERREYREQDVERGHRHAGVVEIGAGSQALGAEEKGRGEMTHHIQEPPLHPFTAVGSFHHPTLTVDRGGPTSNEHVSG